MCGEWIGEGARALGLSGEVTDEPFEALRLNRNPHTGERLTAREHKNRVAFFDIQLSAPKDVSVRGQSISIRLPLAEVFTTRIDNEKTRVFSRDTGLFSSPDPNLETVVLQEAERQLQQAALLDGILKSADQNARNTVSSLLKGFGFSEVKIE